MYATGMACLLDWHPAWLLTLLAANAHRLPEQWQDRYVSVAGEKGRRRDLKDAGRARPARRREKDPRRRGARVRVPVSINIKGT